MSSLSNELYRQGFTQNRELSWLMFNDRVLCEAKDETVPLLERLKFIAIFTSNLDEFFMIRVGSLFDLMNVKANAVDSKSGMTPRQQLDCIYQVVEGMYQKRERIFLDIENRLRAHGIRDFTYSELEADGQKYVRQYFKSDILPILSPQIVDTHHPFPHLQNKAVHIGAVLKHKGKSVFALIPVPAALPELIVLPGETLHYIRIENVISALMGQVFDTYAVAEKVQFCLTRNADVNPDDEAFDFGSDFRKKMKRVLDRRRRLMPVRLELSNAVSDAFFAYLCDKFNLKSAQVYISGVPLRLGHAHSLPARLTENKRGALTYETFSPQIPGNIDMQESIIRQVQRDDILLSFPYEDMAPFLQMIREAAHDAAVVSIKITIYRLASKTKLVEYLCAAAENGKDVTVLIELRARFDEQNNIDWSERLEEAGCKLIYGLEDYKVHSKICLITRKERGEIRYITQVGTGNYNEKTAEVYTDLSLMTANQEIGRDADTFFKNMGIGNLEGQYRHLLVAPVSLKKTVLALIDQEIAKGGEGRIFLKLNSLTDVDIMERLKQASCAGVKIKMVVRGICCLLPGIPQRTENIQVCSIVGRFLEHSRIYCFGIGAAQKLYISSADFMTRNTERRVEVACPIFSEAIKDKIREVMEAAAYDNVKARIMLPDGVYALKGATQNPVNSQRLLMNRARENSIRPPKPFSIRVYIKKALQNLLPG